MFIYSCYIKLTIKMFKIDISEFKIYYEMNINLVFLILMNMNSVFNVCYGEIFMYVTGYWQQSDNNQYTDWMVVEIRTLSLLSTNGLWRKWMSWYSYRPHWNKKSFLKDGQNIGEQHKMEKIWEITPIKICMDLLVSELYISDYAAYELWYIPGIKKEANKEWRVAASQPAEC